MGMGIAVIPQVPRDSRGDGSYMNMKSARTGVDGCNFCPLAGLYCEGCKGKEDGEGAHGTKGETERDAGRKQWEEKKYSIQR